jgi:hypothetical protein
MLTRRGPVSWRRLLRPEVSAWMTLLTVNHWWQQYHSIKTSMVDFAVFTFEKSDDAMMFILRWSK